MGFKADTSFLRFLSMGAVGVHRTMDRFRDHGFAPIELERYCGSNKIWTTKVKQTAPPRPALRQDRYARRSSRQDRPQNPHERRTREP